MIWSLTRQRMSSMVTPPYGLAGSAGLDWAAAADTSRPAVSTVAAEMRRKLKVIGGNGRGDSECLWVIDAIVNGLEAMERGTRDLGLGTGEVEGEVAHDRS
jgi:hypothetical protein